MSGTETPNLSREALAAAFQADIEGDIQLVLDVSQLHSRLDELAAQVAETLSEAKAKHAEAALRPMADAKLKQAGLIKSKLDKYDALARSAAAKKAAPAKAAAKKAAGAPPKQSAGGEAPPSPDEHQDQMSA